MPEVRFDLEVWCRNCKEGLCPLVSTRRRSGEIDIEPCPTCLNRAREEGRAEGREYNL